VRAFDLDVLPKPKRMRLNFVEKPGTPGAPDLNPADVAASMVFSLPGKQMQGNLWFQ
jgi:hypothetical protein